MNDTKWYKVIKPLIENKIKVRVKLTYHEENDNGDVVIAYDSYGTETFLQQDTIFRPTDKYFECSSIGPFKSSEIDWLELNTEYFIEYFSKFKMQLEIKKKNSTVKIFGYKK